MIFNGTLFCNLLEDAMRLHLQPRVNLEKLCSACASPVVPPPPEYWLRVSSLCSRLLDLFLGATLLVIAFDELGSSGSRGCSIPKLLSGGGGQFDFESHALILPSGGGTKPYEIHSLEFAPHLNGLLTCITQRGRGRRFAGRLATAFSLSLLPPPSLSLCPRPRVRREGQSSVPELL